MRRRQWIIALVCVLAAGACTDQSGQANKPDKSDLSGRNAIRLVSFDSCPALLKDLQAATLKSVGPWGLPGSGVEPLSDGRARSGVAADKAPAPVYSGTNIHEQDADEPDIVKTDGRRIVTITGGVLTVVDAATHAVTGRLPLGTLGGGQPDLLLAGDRALVLANAGGVVLNRKATMPTGPARSELLLVDLTGQPGLISRYRIDGGLIDARQTGSTARIVVSHRPKIMFPKQPTDSDGARLRQNQTAITAAPVEAWLPSWEITTGDQTRTGRVDCSAVSRPATYSGAGLVTVLTFDLAAAALTDGVPVAVLADGEIVYGTGDSLYIANNQAWRFTARAPADGGTLATEIFKFTLPATGRPVFAAGGKVPGTLLNQYALSEWDGHLRVATTDQSGAASAVRVLRQQGGNLAQVGEVGGLGKGERIYSVRFIGPRGYVVTFRQTDPLYSLDLADPTKPRVTGELKIPGYSAHLQPAGDDRLIGVGREGDGLLVSYFDVSDPAAPRRLTSYVVSDASSEAEVDPHAILWWPATSLLVLPVNRMGSGGAFAFSVTDQDVHVAARLAVPGDGLEATRRALVVGEELWTLSEHGLLATNLSTMNKVAWVQLA